MSNPNESLAEILARIRAETRGEDGVIYVMDGRKVLEYVDRIEAAVKRDTVTGNAAKLLEALDEIQDKIAQWRNEGIIEHWQYSQLFDIADAALAAPPRNCDRFPTYVDAVAYFNKHNQPLRADPRPNLIDGKKYEDFSEWYADTAAQEGGDHADA